MVDLLYINIVIGGMLGTFGGAMGIYMTFRQLKKQRAEDREKFLSEQKMQLKSIVTEATTEVKNELGKKFDNVENVLKTRGEVLDSIKESVNKLEKDVNEIEKKLIALDTAAKLKLPEIDRIKEDINALKDKVYDLQK